MGGEAGSLLTSLFRMTGAGGVKSRWQVTETDRRAKHYRLTRLGEKRLGTEAERWARCSRRRQGHAWKSLRQ
jgi:DNA-binding PadR family transcriptional regulator